MSKNIIKAIYTLVIKLPVHVRLYRYYKWIIREELLLCCLSEIILIQNESLYCTNIKNFTYIQIT